MDTIQQADSDMIHILSRPDNISLAGNMKRVSISSPTEVAFVLSYEDGNTPIVRHTYTPNSQGIIDIGVEDIITPLLSFNLQDSGTAYRQEHIAVKFKVSISAGEVTRYFSFVVVRAGVDRPAESAETFLRSNFLTWQPTVKPVTYHTPEFLTYYTQEDVIVKCKIYYNEQEKTQTIVLASLAKDKAWTIPVQYAIIAAKAKATPSLYDVWIEDRQGTRLTYIQRYYASDIKSEREQWILFENSLGGIDTFRAYGNTELTARHEHKIAEIEDNAEEYRVDTERLFKKNTGHLNKEERQWLLDFFPSLGKYIYIDNYIRKIVVSESDVSYESMELPSSFDFTFRFADARPYLNLRRAAVPAKMLDVTVPDLGSFTIAPRLVEFRRLNLSGGALFPVQNPYANEWTTTTAAAIIDFVVEVLEKSYSANGGVGHTHVNYSLLQGLSLLEGYLLDNGNKIKAGYADKAGDLTQPVDRRFLSKKRADTAEGLITFLQGIKFSNAAQIDGMGNAFLNAIQTIGFERTLKGFGVWLDESGKAHGQIDYLEVIGKAIFRELEIRKLSGIGGDVILSPASSVIDKVVKTEDGYKCYIKTDDGTTRTMNGWQEGDQARCQTFNVKSGVYKNVGNKNYWRVVTKTAAKTEAEEAYIVLSDEQGYKLGEDIPQAGDVVVLCGHNLAWDTTHGTDAQANNNRMNVTMLTTSRYGGGTIEVYHNIHDFNLRKENAVFHMSGDEVLINSKRIKYIASDGSTQAHVLYRDDWVQGTTAGANEVWYYGGGSWLSIADNNTDEPSKQSPKWKEFAAGGEDGSSPYRVDVVSVSGGNVLRNGQGCIRLSAVVWHGDEDITDTLSPTLFTWMIESGNIEFDAAWNARHEGVGKELALTAGDINMKATINCIVNI